MLTAGDGSHTSQERHVLLDNLIAAWRVDGSIYLDQLVPASGDNDGVGGDRAEAHAGHPLSVAIWVTNGVLALSQGVP